MAIIRRWAKSVALCASLTPAVAGIGHAHADDNDENDPVWVVQLPNHYFADEHDGAIPMCGLVSGTRHEARVHYVFDCVAGREIAAELTSRLPAGKAGRELPEGRKSQRPGGSTQGGTIIVPVGREVGNVAVGRPGEIGGSARQGLDPTNGGVGSSFGQGIDPRGGGVGSSFGEGGTRGVPDPGQRGAGDDPRGGRSATDRERQRAESERTRLIDRPIQGDDLGNALVGGIFGGALAGAAKGLAGMVSGALLGVFGAVGDEAKNMDLGTPAPAAGQPVEDSGEADGGSDDGGEVEDGGEIDDDGTVDAGETDYPPAPATDLGEADDPDWVNGGHKGGRPADDASGGDGVVGPDTYGYRPSEDGSGGGIGGPAEHIGHLYMPAPDDPTGSPNMHFARVTSVAGQLQFADPNAHLFRPSPDDGGDSPVARAQRMQLDTQLLAPRDTASKLETNVNPLRLRR